MTIQQALDLALAHHQAGRLAEAEGLYRQILAVQPNHADALHFLGMIAQQTGRYDLAVDLIRQAIVLDPKNAAAHSNLGEACRHLGRLEEAIAAYHRALKLMPGLPESHYNMGLALREKDQLDDAVAAFRQAIELKSNFAEAHNNLGVALREQGRHEEALAASHRALELKPEFPEAHNNLGIALRDQGQLDGAEAACRRALELKPDYAEAWNSLGNTFNDRGQLDEAMAAYRRALELKPNSPEAHNNLGNALKDQGRLDEAIAAYRHALQIKPDDAGTHSNLVFTLHLHPDHVQRTISEEHQRWNRRFSDPVKRFIQPHANPAVPGRRLRIGYVSPDFRDHPVGRFALPLFERHDRERFEVLCYSEDSRPDWITERFRAFASRWRKTVGVSDARLAEMIREDGVDILVDLAMHTARNRLPVFAHKPAPVQVTWLAYPGSTGLPSIDYRLTDLLMDPPGSQSRGTGWSVEEPIRLPDCWCCYHPTDESPEITALPAWSAKGVTFGSLNKFAKVNERVLMLWARALDALKASRLIMLCPLGSARDRVRAFFGARGIAVERVEFVSHLPRREYLSLYQRIDIGLDPFPCNGMTTTCDALWMGVPVLTLPGEMPVSRAGLSLLSNVGLGAFAAASEDDYVRIAVELGGDLPRLAELRSTMRPRMLGSPLMDAARFARNVEAGYREIWKRWCEDPSPLSD